MPKRKPQGWPNLMVARRLKSGAVSYYWAAPMWAAKAGSPVKGEALGADYAAAKRRCDNFLNPQYDPWRTRRSTDETTPRARPGTFDFYNTSPKHSVGIEARIRNSYDAALALISNYWLKDGRTFGSLCLSSITPGAADLVASGLLINADGGVRPRTVKLAMTAAQRAWNVAWRSKPGQIPSINPFKPQGFPDARGDPCGTRQICRGRGPSRRTVVGHGGHDRVLLVAARNRHPHLIERPPVVPQLSDPGRP